MAPLLHRLALTLSLSLASAIAVANGPALPPPATHDDGAVDAAARGDFATAERLWRPQADAGDAEAQYNLGVLALHGLGREASASAAANWFRLAAKQNYTSAQYNLGLLLLKGGDGVKQDQAAALALFVQAAAAGHPRAREMARLLGRDDAVEKRPARIAPRPVDDRPLQLGHLAAPPAAPVAPRPPMPRRPVPALDAIPATGLMPDRQHAVYADGSSPAGVDRGPENSPEPIVAAAAAEPIAATAVPLVEPVRADSPPDRPVASETTPPAGAAEPPPPVQPSAPRPQPSPARQPAATLPAEVPTPGRRAGEPPAGLRVQLGSLPERLQAEREMARLWQKHADLLSGIEGRVEVAVLNGDRTTFRIRSGPLPPSLPADSICARLAPRGERCLTTR